MATLSHFPTLHSLFTLRHRINQLHSPRNLTPFCVSSINKSRKAKTNAELCDDIRDFVAATGLPQGCVPTMKEFSQHGRSDLAYIVRRRGYKAIGELLGNGEETEENKVSTTSGAVPGSLDMDSDIVSDGNVEETFSDHLSGSSTEDGVDSTDFGREYSTAADSEESSDVTVEDSARLRIDESLVAESSVDEDRLASSYIGRTSDFGNQSQGKRVEEISALSLEEKAASFIKHGNLDTLEENSYFIPKKDDIEDNEGIIVANEPLENVLNKGYAASNFNGSALESVQVVTAKAENDAFRDGDSSDDKNTESNEHLDDESSKGESSDEVDHLKFMLRQKELELSRLKEEIEKEKHALSFLQAKAQTEIKNAQKLISEKDAELQAAEEMLSELVEVLIQYHGDGEFVEVAGSFNGWHHWVKMDLQTSSDSIDHSDSRKSKIWSTVLWLYPGVYEIKFVVDGQWKNDPKMELIRSNDVCNNILRVSR